jgi:beta-galactosidase
MNNDVHVTRRSVVQGMLGVAAIALVPKALPVHAEEGANDASLPRRVLLFNDDWKFHRGDIPGADAVAFDDSGWRELDLPHDWSIEDLPPSPAETQRAEWIDGLEPLQRGPFSLYESEGQTATGWTVGGIGWYRKSFMKPVLPPSGRAEVRFEGIYMNSDVWVNGVHLGHHPYGYTELTYDLTPHLKDGPNVLAVRVDNTGRNSRWYAGSGIYRKVWLTVAGHLRIASHGVYVTMPEVTAAAAVVRFVIAVQNGGARQEHARARIQLLNTDDSVVAEDHVALMLPAGADANVTCTLHLRNPHLWSPESPYLYQANIALEAQGGAADMATLRVGIRKIEIDAAQGLRINGQSVKLRGGCLHNDNGLLGSVCIPRAEERRVEILRANGYNAIRTSHNPPSPELLDACDRLGMLVIDEAFDGWEQEKNPQDYHLYFRDWWKRDLETMIVRDRNHPSVVLWSIGNEVKERAEPSGLEIGKALVAFVHELDPTRKVTAAVCGPYDHPKQTWQDMQPAFTYLDVGGYNYLWKEYANDHAKYPARIMVGTESYANEAFQNWNAIEHCPWVIGDFVWTSMDYIGETGVGRSSIRNGPGHSGGLATYPWFDSYCGDFDLTGRKKSPSYFRDVVWRRSKIEMAVQRPVPEGWTEYPSPWGWSDELRSWSWPGHEGKPLTVRVYTRAERVDLMLNGKQVATKNLLPADALKAEFTIPYAAGEMKATAYEGGTEIANIAFTTTGEPYKLIMTADRPRLQASRDDLSYVMLTVTDKQGRVVPDPIVPVNFTLTGAGEIAGIGNGNPKQVMSFRQPRHMTFLGACTVVVRPLGRPGQIELTASSPGLVGYTLSL